MAEQSQKMDEPLREMPRKHEPRKENISRRKKKGGGHHIDDDSDANSDVDKYGNIKGLIDYDYDSTDESFTEIESVASPIARRTRSKKGGGSAANPIVQRKKKVSPKLVKTSHLMRRLKAEKARLMKRLEQTRKQRLSKKNLTVIESSSSEEEETSEDSTEEEDFDFESETTSSEDQMKEDDEDNDEDDDDSAEDEDSEDDEDDEDDDDADNMPQGISISFGGMPKKDIPKRHNLKKEPEDVKKFVKLLRKPSEDNTIDTQIDQFKGLQVDQQKKVLDVLEKCNANPAIANPSQSLMFKIMTMNLPPETQTMVLSKYHGLQNLDSTSPDYFKQRNWLDKVSSLPLGVYKEMPVKLEEGPEKCNEFMVRAKKCLDDAIFGQEEAKLQILQFIGAKIANPNRSGVSLLLAGPPGIGKTQIIKNGIAKALEWPFQFISLGGDSDASTYTGHQLVYEGSHCGKIVNSLVAAKSMSMILMFDEVDKISTTSKGEEVSNLLIHLTDPVQNNEFEDKYLAGIPIDLSRAMFVFSANNLGKVDPILLDRFVTIQLQGYSVKEKVTIAEQYLFPQALKELNLDEKIAVSKEVLQHIIEEYAKEEDGVRELKRCIEQIVQKMNMLRLFNTKDFPFHIKDFTLPFILKKEHVDIFLKKRTKSQDLSFMKMYT
jgi:ATP-dependent Lon protease